MTEEEIKEVNTTMTKEEKTPPTVEELEKEVSRLKRKLKSENEKTSILEKKYKNLKGELAELRKALDSGATASKNANPSSESNKKLEPSPSTPSKSPSTVSSPSRSQSTVTSKQGWLWKKGAVRNTWVKRWFVLSNKTLSYYESETATDPKGVIPLTNATCYAIVEKKGKLKPLLFNIRTETRDLLMKASDEKTKKEWADAVKAACVKGDLTPEERSLLMRKGSSFLGKISTVEKKEESPKN